MVMRYLKRLALIAFSSLLCTVSAEIEDPTTQKRILLMWVDSGERLSAPKFDSPAEYAIAVRLDEELKLSGRWEPYLIEHPLYHRLPRPGYLCELNIAIWGAIVSYDSGVDSNWYCFAYDNVLGQMMMLKGGAWDIFSGCSLSQASCKDMFSSATFKAVSEDLVGKVVTVRVSPDYSYNDGSQALGYCHQTVYYRITILPPEEVTVDFSANGGKFGDYSDRIRKYSSEGVYNNLPSVTRKNYDFDGWYTAPDGGDKISNGDEVNWKIKALYAHWLSKETYSITLNANGGACQENSVVRRGGARVGDLPTPFRNGYVFDGWYSHCEGGVEIDSSALVQQNMTVFAHWTQGYLVVFDANGGSITEPSRVVRPNQTIGECPTPIRAGHDFVGWFTEPVDGDVITEHTLVKGNVVFYAHWSLLEYEVSFNPVGGSVSPEASPTR